MNWKTILGACLTGGLTGVGIAAAVVANVVDRSVRVQAEHATDAPDVRYMVLTIEGCEYVITSLRYGGAAITHNGNCTNAVHQYR